MKKWLNHTNSAVISIAVTGIFILLTLFLNSLGGFQLDLTANKQNTLSEQTLETIKGVEEDVRMLVFTVNSSSDELLNREVQDIVDEYSKRNNKLKVEDYNLENEPILAQQYGLTASSIVLVQGDKQQVVPMIDLFTSGETEGSYLFSGEEKLTQALNSLSSDEVHRVALLTGHGELDLLSRSKLSVIPESKQCRDRRIISCRWRGCSGRNGCTGDSGSAKRFDRFRDEADTVLYGQWREIAAYDGFS